MRTEMTSEEAWMRAALFFLLMFGLTLLIAGIISGAFQATVPAMVEAAFK